MDHLIIKYLSNQISLQEQHQLSKWLEEDEKHAKTLEKFQLYWEMSRQDLSEKRREVLNRIESEIALEELADQSKVPTGFGNRYLTYLKYAAVLAVVFLSALLVNNIEPPTEFVPSISYIEKVSAAGQKMTIRLPDGSSVKLNSESKLIFPSQFTGGKREVVLFGEAFFDVTRDESSPFLIKTADMSVQVLGTSFVVRAFSGGSNQFVAVKTGEVKVINSATSDSVQLTQNLIAHLSKRTGFSEVSSVDEHLVFGWIDQKLVFKDHTITEVFDTIEKWYGVEVNNAESINSDKSFTALFENPTLKEVMGSLSHMYQFKYETNDNVITIEP